MLYIRILLLGVFISAALGVFDENDKEKKAEYTKVLLGTALLYIVAERDSGSWPQERGDDNESDGICQM